MLSHLTCCAEKSSFGVVGWYEPSRRRLLEYTLGELCGCFSGRDVKTGGGSRSGNQNFR
jgi:hypothetical protein